MKKKLLILSAVVVVILLALILISSDEDKQLNKEDTSMNVSEPVQSSQDAPVIIRESVSEDLSTATFAGGCFWCTEAVLQEIEGVENAISGYAGGTEFNPTYEAVYKEITSHKEAVRVYYDPEIVSYEEIVDVYWQSIDPTDSGGQFVDRGESYTTAIFYESEEQKIIAENSKSDLQVSGRFNEPLVTDILPFSTFYEAEEYHQDFYLNSKDRYKNYSSNSGRDEFKAQVWQEIQNQ